MNLPDGQQQSSTIDDNTPPQPPQSDNDATPVSEQVIIVKDDDYDENIHHDDDNGEIRRGFISLKKKSQRRIVTFVDTESQRSRHSWSIRPYYLGGGLFFTLFAFWMLDSLKDPIFGMLVDGNLDKHQPPAKLWSVGTTLVLVLLMEAISHYTREKRRKQQQQRDANDVLDPGGHWTRMDMTSSSQQHDEDVADNDSVPISIFTIVGGSYITVFSIIAYLLHFHPSTTVVDDNNESSSTSTTSRPWYVLGYVLYACIESFGSISVATFWSYTNSTLSLDDAEHYYGLIVAIAQVGAIGGSTIVTTTNHFWSTTTLILVANFVIVLQVLTMTTYAKRFPPTATTNIGAPSSSSNNYDDNDDNLPAFWSGIYLILKHRYVMLILGVSCLYEVSLTCLDYQMKLLGWFKFEETTDVDESESTTTTSSTSFTQFMGFYGMVCNICSLFFSYIVFPYLIRRYGLRLTLRLFPTLLLVATILAFRAVPGNLAVLFVSMTILKAMTYSIHDPSKEILYLPTSLAIKFRSKFWIDVVGARVAKAMGSTINTYAGNVDQSIRVGTIPSLLSAAGLWLVCYRAGIQFDRLIRTGNVVGSDVGCDYSPRRDAYGKLSTREEEECFEDDVPRGLTADESIEDMEGNDNDIELKPIVQTC